jgi:hypothetical protein
MKHQFVSGVADGSDATQVRPQSNWNAAHVFSIRALGANTTLLSTDDGIRGSGTTTFILPKVSTLFDGQQLWIKNVGTGVITITPDATVPDTIDGQSGWILPNQYDDVELIANVASNTWDTKGAQ